MGEVVQAAKSDGIKTMIGGAPVTQSFCDEIGADGYAPDAASAVDLAKGMM
jgi:methanogenic corrinoid protein MtbC1